jgi:carboxyl-terminal processing protease
VQADSSLRAKGIKPGVEILAVDGIPVKEYAAKFVTPYQSASTPQDLANRSYEYALLSGSVKKTIQLKIQDDKGVVSTQAVTRVTGRERSAKMSFLPLEYKVLPGNISYLAINGFDTDTGSKYFIQHYAEIEKGNGLIIDLRNNGGGNTDWTILRYLVDSVMSVHQMYSREYVPTKRAWESAQSVWTSSNGIGPVPGHRYDKPVILLVSARTFSAAEDFAAAFKSIHKGKILGQPTGGSTGQPLFFTLPGNITARVCTKRDRYADGTDFVGKGILPDIIVYPTVSDIRKGVDTELEAALKEMM